MELNEAIEALEGLIEPQSYTLGGYDKEALRTVLTELNRLQKANETLNSFIEWGTNPFVKEIKEGNNEQV